MASPVRSVKGFPISGTFASGDGGQCCHQRGGAIVNGCLSFADKAGYRGRAIYEGRRLCASWAIARSNAGISDHGTGGNGGEMSDLAAAQQRLDAALTRLEQAVERSRARARAAETAAAAAHAAESADMAEAHEALRRAHEELRRTAGAVAGRLDHVIGEIESSLAPTER
jgi:hypothetical protein